MPLTGIEIYKLLPKTNCKECGVPTCLAFAMSLAAGKASLDACPYISADAKVKLAEASTPPILPITIGAGDKAFKIGGQTVLFRHEKRFDNTCGLAVLISDTMPAAEVAARLQRFKMLRYERVDQLLCADAVALKCDSADPAKFASLARQVQAAGVNIILMSENPELLAAGLEICAASRPLLYAATFANYVQVVALAKTYQVPVAVKASGLDELADLTAKITALGIKDLVIDSGSRTLQQAFQDQVIIRSAALIKKFRPLGFPTIVFPCEMTEDPMMETVIASVFIAKYGGLVVLSDIQGHSLFPLLVERLNIYTDPQRPLATAEGIYPIGNPTASSPVLITANFSLTYFIVSGEIENSRVSSWLLVKDTDGLSVLTAWAAGKFSADTIAPFIQKSGIAGKLQHRKLIIPGYIAVESGSLEEELSGWQIDVGPREGTHIPAYLRQWQV